MLYTELTTVSEVLKHVPENARNRFSPSGWDAWMKWVDTWFADELRKFDIELVHRFYEYKTASEAVRDLGGTEDDIDLKDEDACLELLENAETDSGCASGLDYRVVKVLKTASGSVLVWSE